MCKLVSILIPAYNAERWIQETIESALNQTWHKKEIIIVDDGSSDCTLEIARRYESGMLKVIKQENRGASAARNSALSCAQGDYIQWLDADDLLAHDKICQQVQQAEKGYGQRTLFSGSFAKFYTRPNKAKFISNSLWGDFEPVEWLIIKFRENVWMSPAVWLVSRTLTECVGPWDERLSLDDDGEYFSRVVASSERIHYVPEAKVYYRQWHSGSLSRTNSDKACHSLFLSLLSCIGSLRSLEDSKRTHDACVQLLQNWSHYFYPEKPDLYDKLNGLAIEMGAVLIQPQLKKKYILIKNLFGWHAVKQAMAIVANAKLNAFFRYDQWMARF